MSVSKRLRYEVLRRDDFACRYCGAKAPDVSITVDHVIPVALGGEDRPDNLVTACVDCNAGKAATNPAAPLVASVASVADDALRWAAAMDHAALIQRERASQADAYIDTFWDAWKRWTYDDGRTLPLPAGWEDSLARFYELELDTETVDVAVRKAMTKRNLRGEHGEFDYMCGVLWSIHQERQSLARELLKAGA